MLGRKSESRFFFPSVPDNNIHIHGSASPAIKGKEIHCNDNETRIESRHCCHTSRFELKKDTQSGVLADGRSRYSKHTDI